MVQNLNFAIRYMHAVGGLRTVINRFELLALWIDLASLIAVATISIVYMRAHDY